MLSEERIAELWEMGYVAKLTQRAFAFARAIEAAVLAEKQEPYKRGMTLQECADAEYKQEPVAWVGCGECDCEFPCYHGKTTCLRLPTEKQEPVKDEPFAWVGHSGNLAYSKKAFMPSVRDKARPLYTRPQPETKNAGYWHKCHEIAESTNVALRKQIQDLTAEVERLKEINRDLCSKSNSYIVANAQQKERIAELEAQDTEMCDVHAQLLVEHGKAKLHIAALEEAAREARDAFEQHDGNYKLSKASGAIVDAAIAKLDAVIKEVL